MSSGKNPLVLMMALSMPGAANALGLGDIHVDSGLNERLAAEIDIVGATALDLTDLQAAVADRETFLHYGADRPAFLSSTTFKVTQDSHGRPQLAIRSSESFTEPVVNFLVDLRWHNGEMIRQYTLLLDPPGLAAANVAAVAKSATAAPSLSAPALPAAPDVPAMPAAAAPSAETKAQPVSRRLDPPRDQPDSDAQPASRKTTHVKVGAKATLRGIAWRVGERSEPDLQRMMIAIFRANPNAFDGNINRLHRGAVLTIPSRAELAAISKADATREVHAQMAAWHSPTRTVASSDATATPAATVAAPNVAASPSAATPSAATPSAATPSPAISNAESPRAATAPNTATSPAAGQAPDTDSLAGAALGQRVQSLEQELTEMKGLLESERTQLVRMQGQTAAIGQPAPDQAPQAVAAPQAQPKSGSSVMVPIIAGLGILGAALAGLYFKFRRRALPLQHSRIDGGIAAGETAAAADMDAFRAEQDPPQDLALQTAQQNAQAVAQPDAPADKPIDARMDAPIHANDDTQEAMAYIDDATHPLLPVLAAAAPAGRSEIAAAPAVNAPQHEPTVNMRVDTVNLRVASTRLDYNLLDLDLTAQHVQMPSVLNEHAVVKERRTNLADVLKLAIEREPDRHDLRMKLLELYYSAAATNRRAFLDVVQKLARDRGHLPTDQWDKIAFMGRQIAAENPLFAEETAADDDLADCA